ncbi:hypothetical protein Pfo_017401 [Paulownia fortunei]|nr:hypothetical protein Pfo_017401 [Paulownia fortunei]
MLGFRVFLLIFYFISRGHARYHHRRINHKHHSHHASQFSMPPSLPPEASGPSTDENWNNYTVIYDVRMFGAVGDGVTDDTEALKTAWDAACQTDSGVLHVPSGYTFMIQSTIFTGPCQSGFVFQVTLSYPAIRFYMSNNLTVQGIKIRNSPQFHFRFDSCKNVHIESIYITAPASSPNTDGIHIENANNVERYNSVISNDNCFPGDDCVSLGSGCYDADIKNITCGPSHGISIGSLGSHNSRACASNITVRDSVIKNSDNGVRIKTWQGGCGAVSGVTFDNIHMDNVRNPIIIDQFYCISKDCTNHTSAVYLSDIQYMGIKGTYDIRSPPMHFACGDSIPCTNITLSDVELLPAKGDMVLDPFCWNAYGELQTLTIPPVSCLSEGIPRSILENDIGYC